MAWRADFPQAPRLFWAEVCVRCFLITAYIALEDFTPFHRIIQPEEYWLYRFPQTASYITTQMLYGIAIGGVLLTVLFFFIVHRSYLEAWAAVLAPSLAIPLNGVITNCIKLTVGRPRPDYFDRCYPGVTDFDASRPCTGNLDDIIEGRKSFPSGHSSAIFCAFGFISMYTAGQLGLFNRRGRGQAWRVVACLTPLMLAVLVAISRTMDYHHHWQDVTVGSIIGFFIAYLVYRQYFPSLGSLDSNVPLLSSRGGYRNFPDCSGTATSVGLIRPSISQPNGVNGAMKSV